MISTGNKAVTISVDATSSVAGLVAPGDYVDVMFTYDLTPGRGADVSVLDGVDIPSMRLGKGTVTETVLTNVKVIAVDQRLVAGGDDKKKNARAVPRSITLEVDAQAAQKLKTAQKQGEVSLVLRSLTDVAKKDDVITPATLSEVSQLIPDSNFGGVAQKPDSQSQALDRKVEKVKAQSGADKSNRIPNLGRVNEEREDGKVDINVYRGLFKTTVQVPALEESRDGK